MLLRTLKTKVFSPFLLALLGSINAQHVYGQALCENATCTPVQATAWSYRAYFSEYFGVKETFGNPADGYAALISLAKSRFGSNCQVNASSLSASTPSPTDPDQSTYASFQLTYGPIDPNAYPCNGFGLGTITGHVDGYRTVSCPRGAKYYYLPTGSICVSPRKKVIAIDPGHGLKCPLINQAPGAIGITDYPASDPPAGKLREDDLTVAISLEAERFLSAKYKVVLTKRDVDSCPSLKERGRIANNANAKVFLSVHINAPNLVAGIPNPFGNGTSVLYNSARPATKTLADQMALDVSTSLGTNNRGSQVNDSIAVLKPTVTNMTAVLLEVARLSGTDETILHRIASITATAIGLQSAVQTQVGN